MPRFFVTIFNKTKLFVLFWLRIVFVKNKYKVSFINKLRCNFGGGYLADQYVLYDLKHNDKKDFLSEFDWYRSRLINEPYNAMMNNKVICSDILKMHIKTPEIFYIKTKNKMVGYESKTSDYNEVLEKIKKEATLFMKPISAGKGRGVRTLSYDKNEETFQIDYKIASREDIYELLAKEKGWFISQAIYQADYLNEIYDKTTNTLRLITLKDYETNIFYLFFAVQRIGTKETIPVDNGSTGGLISKVDLETGMLSEARTLHSDAYHDFHPDSKAKIKGTIIPDWPDIKEEIVRVSNEFPYLNFIAWDLLISKEGPVIIEANTSSGVNIIQIWGGQKKGELGNFYRKHGVIK